MASPPARPPFFRYFLLSAAAGAFAVAGFAPLDLFPLPIIALGVLFSLWLRAADARTAFLLGWAFGFGLFAAGTGWIYVALHDYGDMPFPLALAATALFAAFLALLPGLAGYLQAKFPMPTGARLILLMPAVWTSMELLRGYLFTGFPWLTLGYSQLSPSMLAGYAPIMGVYGVSLMVALTAGLTLWVYHTRSMLMLFILIEMLIGGSALRMAEWTQPVGEPFSVALVQGNVSQETKFEESRRFSSLGHYRQLAAASRARLTVLPETALPLLREELPPEYVRLLAEPAQSRKGDLLVGLFEREGEQYFNSVVSLGSSPEQHYRKNHLVPFGEFIPLRPLFGPLINDVLHIPMSDLARGGIAQTPLEVAGQKVAVDICYEDVFGEEIVRALPAATLLVNVTNDAWYGHSHAAAQHNQISQMRALESGRMMLRATNTGVTAIIGRDGVVQDSLPQHQEGILNGEAQGYTGLTPYARWGNALVIVLLILMLLAVQAIARPRAPQAPGEKTK